MLDTITSEIPQPSPAQVTTENPSTSLTWKTQKINIEEDTELTGKITINMEMKLPSDWIFKTTPVASSTDNMITNCSTYTATSNDKLISLTLQPICRGWAAKTSSWPADAVIAFHRDCAGNDGNHTCYRVRTSASSSGYSYVDSVTEPNRPLNKSQDKVMDGLMVGYAPPNDSTGDYFFIPSHLTVTYSGSTSQKENYLSIADQIAASITLR